MRMLRRVHEQRTYHHCTKTVGYLTASRQLAPFCLKTCVDWQLVQGAQLGKGGTWALYIGCYWTAAAAAAAGSAGWDLGGFPLQHKLALFVLQGRP